MRNYAGMIGKMLIGVVLLGILYAYAMFQGGFVSWFLFYAMLPFLLYMILLVLYPISNWSIERSLSKQVLQTGDTLTVTLTIDRKMPFPLYFCIIEDYVPETFQRAGVKAKSYQFLQDPKQLSSHQKVKRVAFPWFMRKIRYEYTFENVPRGEHKFHTIRVRTGDFFGFIKKQHYYTVGEAILVYPHKRDVGITKRMNSFEEGASPSYSPAKKNTTIVTGVREYVPGDRFSWIDWKNTAKKNSFMTKEFEPQKSSDVMLILDANMVEKDKSLAFEGSVELCASLIQSYRRLSSQLAFMVLGEERKLFPFTKDALQQDYMNHYLARVEPTGKANFGESLLMQQRVLPKNSVLMLVTNTLNADLKSTISRLKQHTGRVVLFYIDAADRIGALEKQIIRELQISGVVVNVMTEGELTKPVFEVST
ncbi:DUF58 domain-containing protein [Pontibacillus salicampi]|uniref:DUF58 domain-containing protein n=1 Tax=Pontibacillus salicampi TaxID=1449801 RepID=A0ABV6LTV4_9BACI